MLTLIAARDRNGAIGRANTIPWHVPEDFAFFKRETTGGAIIMGRRTWDSLPRRPLPDRLNIVVSRQVRGMSDGAVFTDLDQALPLARDHGHDRIYCIGGAEIYRQMMAMADRVLLSTVDLRITDADAFFPPLAPAEWDLTSRRHLRTEAPSCIVEEYRRASAAPEGA